MINLLRALKYRFSNNLYIDEGIRQFCHGFDWHTRTRQQKAQDLKNLRNTFTHLDAKQIITSYNLLQQHVNQQSTAKPSLSSKQPNKSKPETKQIWDKLGELKARDLSYSTANQFPPEPNGYLHLGHARAIRVNFESAVKLSGVCNLRFDDSNPAKQYDKYAQMILSSVEWLTGNKIPINQIKRASDYFAQMEQYAWQLINTGNAYVCKQDRESLKATRDAKQESPYRNTPIATNLSLFQQMKDGLHPEGSLSLRLRLSPAHDNPTLRDPIIYRIKNIPHPITKHNHHIYPLYDFTHCLSDSIEGITHSLCTLEFETRRDLYYIILDLLAIHKPFVYEYSRVNIKGNVLSKRKIEILVNKGLVDGWNDPRLLTLAALKRRGFCPASINAFVDTIGCSRNGNKQIININILYTQARKIMNTTTNRLLVVLDPVLIKVHSLSQQIEIANNQYDMSKGTRKITLDQDIHIDKQDLFRFKDQQIVGLKYCGEFKVSLSNSQITLTRLSSPSLQKTYYVHWISTSDSLQKTVRIYNDLFTVDDPMALDGDAFLQSVRHDSLVIYNNARFPKNMSYENGQRWQFERLGYFSADQDGAFNRIVPI